MSAEPFESTNAHHDARAEAQSPPRPAPVAPAGFVNLHFVMTSLKRRRRWIVAFAITGLLVGALLTVVHPRRPSATVAILVAHTTGADPARAMATDLSLLQTDSVARRVISSLGLHESVDDMRSQFSGAALSDDVLEVTATGSSAGDARRRTDAVAHEFLAFRKEVYDRQSSVVVKALEDRARSLQEELDSLTAKLGPAATSSASSADPQLADQIQRRAQLSAEVTSLQASIQDNATSTTAVVEGSRAIDTARVVEVSKKSEIVKNAASGLAAGLGLGIGLVVLLAVTSNRVWRREDIARAFGAPVALSVGPLSVRRWAPVGAMRAHLRTPSPDLERIVHHLRSALPADVPALAVVSVNSLDASVLATCRLATVVDDPEVRRAVVVDFTGTGLASATLDVDPIGHAEPGGEPVLAATPAEKDAAQDHRVPPTHDPELLKWRAEPLFTHDVVIAVTALDPAVGAQHVREFAARAVAIVTAGRSTASALRANADMLRTAGIEVHSVVLVGADRYDDSLGVYADSPPPAWQVDSAHHTTGESIAT